MIEKKKDIVFITYPQTFYESNENNPIIESSYCNNYESSSLASLSLDEGVFSSYGGCLLTTVDSDSNKVFVKVMSISDSCGTAMPINEDNIYVISQKGNLISIDEDLHQIALSYQNEMSISNLERGALEFALQTRRNGSDVFVFTESNVGIFCEILKQERIESITINESGLCEYSHCIKWKI